MFALIWTNRALTALADLYTSATVEERERIAAGVDALNARLRNDPLTEGESRTGNFRVAFPVLLLVVFHVGTASRTVTVTWVRRYGH